MRDESCAYCMIGEKDELVYDHDKPVEGFWRDA